MLSQFWYGDRFRILRWMLWPIAGCYALVSFLRRFVLQRFCQHRFAVPIVVVGNITVGGVGKTPLVIALAKQCQARGLRVGIVSRGYGARVRHFPYEITETDSAQAVGDEPFLLFAATHCPVVIAPKRVDAVAYLLRQHRSQIIISDDGLQHYAMGRSVEIVVIDGMRLLGNGLHLPAGPLRESPKRLQVADLLVVNEGIWPGAYRMDLRPKALVHLLSGKTVALDALQGPIAAVAGVGNPERFFATLRTLGVVFNAYVFPDHHNYCAQDLQRLDNTIVMTEKDAVKCRAFASEGMYYLPVEASLEHHFWDAFWRLLSERRA